MRRFLVLGAGYTGSRVVRLLRQQQAQVVWTNRDGSNGAHAFDASIDDVSNLRHLYTPETAVLHSIPTVRNQSGTFEITPNLMSAARDSPPARIVYLSTTGVYGKTAFVNELTKPAPETERERLRILAEDAVRTGPWSSLVLRPAAIYGPGRGIHSAMRSGQFRLPPDPSNFVSRIHVEDLAAIVYAALQSDIEGAYPVADEEPCTSLEASKFCAALLDISLPATAPDSELGETRRANRRVDGSAICRLLGVQLRYPSYKIGFPASLAAEARERSMS